MSKRTGIIIGIAAAAVAAVLAVFLASPAKIKKPDRHEAMEMLFVGDTMLGDFAKKVLAAKGYDAPFKNLREALSGGDFLIGNLEATITRQQEMLDKSKAYSYRQAPKVARVFAKEGLYAFSLANNHTLDFGVEGLKDTMTYLDKTGIKHFGAGLSEEEARRPLIIEKNGIRLAVIGCFEISKAYEAKYKWYAEGNEAGIAGLEIEKVKRQIADLKGQTDLVAVVVHWGSNYRRVTKQQKSLARELVYAGADLIIGHGAHIPQIVEIVDGIPVIYSLGNFIFGSPGRYKNYKV
jgi:poly-gamma-glutamate synthesis protein (capsule biosynthesis protein)